jgi:hypothetical protein
MDLCLKEHDAWVSVIYRYMGRVTSGCEEEQAEESCFLALPALPAVDPKSEFGALRLEIGTNGGGGLEHRRRRFAHGSRRDQ